MKAQKFELFMGCLGNGITLCNKAVEEHGDYKIIGHIGENGKLKLYVSEDYIPPDSMEIIKCNMAAQKKKYMEWWNTLPIERKYGTMLDNLPVDKFLNIIKMKDKSMEEKVKIMETEFL